jgi:hypothetical protein
MKTASGSPVEKAGLTNGSLYGVKVNGVGLEDRVNGIASGTQFTLFNLGDVQNMTGAQLQTASVGGGVSEFLRPEDGGWDPSNPSDFYFVTTDRFDTVKNGTGTTVGAGVVPVPAKSRLADVDLVLIDSLDDGYFKKRLTGVGRFDG